MTERTFASEDVGADKNSAMFDAAIISIDFNSKIGRKHSSHLSNAFNSYAEG
jgi:hypothetical protein